MKLRFTKMHGLGNDFVVIDLVTQEAQLTPKLLRAWSDRHTGVGFDQLLAVEPPDQPHADFRFRIYNADGTEAEQCGNGARCFARFVAREGLSRKTELVLQAADTCITTNLCRDGNVEVNMGRPKVDAESVPVVSTQDGPVHRLVVAGEQTDVVAVSMGNPHAVLFVDDIANAPVARLGSAIGAHGAFPQGVNVGFCEVVDRGFARLRVFERGVGETRACGSGACAAVVAGRLTDRMDSRVKISLPGGKARISWQGGDSVVKMLGPAKFVFEGELDL